MGLGIHTSSCLHTKHFTNQATTLVLNCLRRPCAHPFSAEWTAHSVASPKAALLLLLASNLSFVLNRPGLYSSAETFSRKSILL